jgi:hypothetical protein
LRAHLAECRRTKIERVLAGLCGVTVERRSESRSGSHCRSRRDRSHGTGHEHRAEDHSPP